MKLDGESWNGIKCNAIQCSELQSSSPCSHSMQFDKTHYGM